jgi:hypothetical protein
MTPQPEQRSHRDEGRRPFRASGACTAVPPSAAASVFTFTFNERVVVRSTATLKAWQDVDYGAVPTDSDVKSNVWLQDGPNIVFAKTISGRGTATRMSEVSWYRRDPPASSPKSSTPRWQRMPTPAGGSITRPASTSRARP